MKNLEEGSTIKIVALIVLYKTNIFDSKSLKTLLNSYGNNIDVELVLWDNSPLPVTQALIDRAKKIFGEFKYISTPENKPLSQIYNKVIQDFDFDYIFLLDQDSIIPANYLSNTVHSAVQVPEVMLFLPLVKNGFTIVSPGSFYGFKGKHWKKERRGKMPVKNIVAITSGMLIAKKYFIKYLYKFDERLNLYAIDTKFMLDYACNEEHVFVTEQTFSHDSALWSNPSADELLPRFKNMRSAYAIMLSNHPFFSMLTKAHTIYLSFKYAVKYRDMRFLRFKSV
ncbi:glycosyltransferase [Pontibacter sp. SGAir0037]|uniref:glycosyltransferase n=1 Tax=Pontibacter sp. SGAir0037 TaxID=2571030 RepID=UPI0010CCF913|nr:glycosyltransferase [Pontibacter sp. SGAir0037]QCR20982.1 hypothetical protein C1N53_00445 [Pontibacter sp. SGAir0037]